MNRSISTWVGLSLGVVLLFAVNLFSNATFTSTRLDLTENDLYTLTEGTRSILSNLEEPVTLRLFLSREQATRLPGIGSYAQRVSELLQEYKRQASGRLRLELIDPEPFSEAEDRAVGYGLQGVVTGDGADQFYFGLAGTNSTDDQEIIPFFSPSREELLEHDLTKLIYQLANPKPKVVGLISGLNMQGGAAAFGGGGQQGWVILEQIRQLFQVRVLETTVARIPVVVDVLMVVHPKDLDDRTLYAIDQFVLGGGRALVFVDPNAEADRAPGMMGMGSAPGSSSLDKLFRQWGVGLAANMVAADLQLAEKVRFGQQQGQAVAEYPVWMNLLPPQINAEDVVTAKLGNLLFASPGVLEDLGTDGVEVTPLVQTTSNAMKVDAAQLRFMQDPMVLLRQYKPGSAKLTLAVRVSGRVSTAFADGAPPEVESERGEFSSERQPGNKSEADIPAQAHVAESKQDINVILVSDTDMLSDQFWVQTQNFLGSRLYVPTASNGDFVINALENLVGSNDLISVRSRGQFSRPFTRVASIQQQAELRFRQKEQELLTQLRTTETQLLELEQGKQQGQDLILSDAQRDEIARFREQKIGIRKDLRHVRHQLRKDIENLESWTRFMNVGLMPLLIGIGGVVLGLGRTRRRNAGITSSDPRAQS